MNNPTTNRRRVHAFVAGKVQGVWYRVSTQEEANRLELSGWVRNLDDGRVEFVAEGVPQDVEALLHWARRGPPHARVDTLEVTEETPEGDHAAFEVRR